MVEFKRVMSITFSIVDLNYVTYFNYTIYVNIIINKVEMVEFKRRVMSITFSIVDLNYVTYFNYNLRFRDKVDII